jgi:hypothetical protein
MKKTISSILYLASVVYFFLSCATKSDIDFNETKLVVVPDIKQQQENQWIKNNLELDGIVPIETTDEFLLSGIKRVILYKDKLILLDRRQPNIFVVNAYTGKVETFINNRGIGPGESRQIRDIAFDDKREHILVFNDFNKLIFFSIDGKFLKEEKVDKLFENITYDKDNVFFYNDCVGYSCYPHSINVYNLTDQKWKMLGMNKKVDFNVRGRGCLLVKSKNIWFTPVLDYGLHVLINDTIKVPYQLDVKKTLTDELIKKSVSDFPAFNQYVFENNIFFGIQSIRETENFLIFSTNFPALMMMDKNTLNLQETGYVEDKYLGIQLFNYFPHDGDDNRIMFVVRPEEWKRRKPYNGDGMPEHLKAQIENTSALLRSDNNPILVFFKVK